ncbi:hypothetical protein BU14_0617s0012 [Porphyra umbilicalis]|uniref:Uncharacterized protein n=1 Tax=Porphyra umbilicalis TaxID=2786 RepID=A0A1X6NR00_PORUM|nr:hypothetical protein BU14_0617s0012 [Porphyra umbilicalis]|eukprot:OSX71007.1 hypothetical protein BU14_0617s0012 [Porphyra umbilicalis]
MRGRLALAAAAPDPRTADHCQGRSAKQRCPEQLGGINEEHHPAIRRLHIVMDGISDPTVAHMGISSADSGGARNTRRHAAATAHAAAAGGHTPWAAVDRHHPEAAPAAPHAQYRMSAAPVAAVHTWTTTKDATDTMSRTYHCHALPDVVDHRLERQHGHDGGDVEEANPKKQLKDGRAAARHVAAPNSVVEETNVTTATAAAAASAPKSATKSARHSGGESHQEAVTPTVADHPLGTRAMSASDAAPAARRCTTAGGFGDVLADANKNNNDRNSRLGQWARRTMTCTNHIMFRLSPVPFRVEKNPENINISTTQLQDHTPSSRPRKSSSLHARRTNGPPRDRRVSRSHDQVEGARSGETAAATERHGDGPPSAKKEKTTGRHTPTGHQARPPPRRPPTPPPAATPIRRRPPPPRPPHPVRRRTGRTDRGDPPSSSDARSVEPPPPPRPPRARLGARSAAVAAAAAADNGASAAAPPPARAAAAAAAAAATCRRPYTRRVPPPAPTNSVHNTPRDGGPRGTAAAAAAAAAAVAAAAARRVALAHDAHVNDRRRGRRRAVVAGDTNGKEGRGEERPRLGRRRRRVCRRHRRPRRQPHVGKRRRRGVHTHVTRPSTRVARADGGGLGERHPRTAAGEERRGRRRRVAPPGEARKAVGGAAGAVGGRVEEDREAAGCGGEGEEGRGGKP